MLKPGEMLYIPASWMHYVWHPSCICDSNTIIMHRP
ncbi:MAG: hypothetical protein ACREYE_25735 [Gammaproteobacteria bacterium]